MSRARFDENQLEALKESTALSRLFAEAGYKTRGAGRAIWCLCPFHLEKSGSCKINDQMGRYHCFGCGAQGDHFEFLMHDRGLTFVEAVEALGGVREITPEDRARIEARRAAAAKAEAEDRERNMQRVRSNLGKYRDIEGTHAAAYLAGRGLTPSRDWTFDLRYAPSLLYKGYLSADADEQTDLGNFPCMVAAIRNADFEVIGLHRTYLDPERPVKLSPPGDASRNKAKKILGEQRGGLIWLSPPTARVVHGEGIETTQSWRVLAAEREGETGAAVGISLGNISGRCTGSVRHPKALDKRCPNGHPDLDEPGINWPPEVQEIVFLQDGDSDPAITSARIIAGMRRANAQGKTTFRDVAPDGSDFNDVLQVQVQRNDDESRAV